MNRVDTSELPRSEIIAVEYTDQQLNTMLEQALSYVAIVQTELRRRINARYIDEE